MKGPGDQGILVDEAVVEVAEAEESSKLAQGRWWWPIEDGPHLVEQHLDKTRGDVITEEGGVISEELTLLGLGIEVVVSEAAEDLLGILYVLLPGRGVYKDVVQVDEDTTVHKVSQRGVDEILE